MRRLALLGAGVLVVAGLLFALHRDLPGWYAQAMPAWYARTVYPLEHEDLIRQAARRNDLDPAMVVAVIYAESGFREGAVSERGAIGLMQLLPATAEEIARRTGGGALRGRRPARPAGQHPLRQQLPEVPARPLRRLAGRGARRVSRRACATSTAGRRAPAAT